MYVYSTGYSCSLTLAQTSRLNRWSAEIPEKLSELAMIRQSVKHKKPKTPGKEYVE